MIDASAYVGGFSKAAAATPKNHVGQALHLRRIDVGSAGERAADFHCVRRINFALPGRLGLNSHGVSPPGRDSCDWVRRYIRPEKALKTFSFIEGRYDVMRFELSRSGSNICSSMSRAT